RCIRLRSVRRAIRQPSCSLLFAQLLRPRHSSANQYIDRHAARPASSASQLNGRTNEGAATSNATVAPIFLISHNMTLTAEATGDRLESRLVMPRANSAPGTTAVTAPYSAHQACFLPAQSSHAESATTPPTTACTAITRQGDSCGCSARNAAACEGVSRLKRSSASSHAPRVPDDRLRSDIARSWVGTKPADYTEIPEGSDPFRHTASR